MRKNLVSYHDDLMETLHDPEERAEYVNAALEDGDPKVLLMALRHVAEATGGMRSLSSKAKLSRETLYRTLSPRGNPELSSLERIFSALGLSLRVVIARKHAHAH
jgi:probable addiction module antidote protein